MLKIVLMGPPIDHRQSLSAMLHGRVASIDWIADSASLAGGRSQSTADRVRRAVDQLTYTRSEAFIEPTCRLIDDVGADVLIAFWGTMPLADIAAVKRARPRVRTVLMVLCHPLALSKGGRLRQNWMMQRASRFIDGYLFPGPHMAAYFTDTILGPHRKHPPFAILPPCWPAEFQARERPAAISDEPNVIYVGRTDLSHHTIHAADDLRPLMREILKAGIALHHLRSAETDDGHPLRQVFEPQTLAQLIAHMPTHDASLIAYNTDACAVTDRFDLTVPDRLISSVAAGVPIAIPEKGYAASKTYLANYPAVFEFADATDLKAQLGDRSRVSTIRDAAWLARGDYAAQKHGETLMAFLASIS